MDPVCVALARYHVTEIDWSSSSGSNTFLSYKFATGTVQRYLAGRHVPVKRKNVNNGPMVPELAPVVDFNWCHGVAR